MFKAFQQNFVVASGVGSRRITTTAYPVPVPPDEYDPKYRPDFFILVSAGEEVFDVIDTTIETMENEVIELIINTVVIGAAGVVLFLCMVWRVSLVITRPLQYIEMTAWKIVNHANERHAGLSVDSQKIQ